MYKYVLIACEESQRVCVAFRELGFEAFSCDVQECSGGHPEWHIQGDVLKVLNPQKQFIPGDEWFGFKFRTMDGVLHCIEGKWDLIIAFPPCTYMTNAGACRMYPKKGQVDLCRLEKAYAAKDFFMEFYNCDCEHICIENPVPLKIVGLPLPTQKIQPYMFGHAFSKRTCLWLKGLPELVPTCFVDNGVVPYVSAGSFDSKGNRREKVGCTNAAKERSKTFVGVARAMAEQWSVAILDNGDITSSNE